MTNTGETIENLKLFRETVIETMKNREVVSFNLGSIDIDNERMSVDGSFLTEDATKKVLSKLRVKNNFLELSKNMNPSDWEIVKDKLKRVQGNQVIHGRKVDNSGTKLIDDIYMAAPKTTGIMELDAIFAEVIDSIVSTGKDISLKSTCFLEDKDEINVTLLEHDAPIDIFVNGEDVWKTGKRIVWNGMNFSVAPFFERLVCSNGNTAPQFGFKANISNNKFNIERIKNVLTKEITLQSDTMDNYLVDAVNHLKHNNVSVREFLKFRSFFNEEDHAPIISKWFDENSINRAYGCIVSEQPDLWQVTADSNKNAYDFFNILTWIASHDDAEITLTNRERVDLQINASNLLFRKQLDLESLAPKVEWKAIKVS